MFITYFIGCFWFYYCNFTTDPAHLQTLADETDFAESSGDDSIINDDGKKMLS